MAEFIYVALSVIGCLLIVSYATWLLVVRLKAKDSPAQSFWQWLKHIFEGVMGL
jgi:membrane protein CcdC involved in cytochrome C biogenesis